MNQQLCNTGKLTTFELDRYYVYLTFLLHDKFDLLVIFYFPKVTVASQLETDHVFTSFLITAIMMIYQLSCFQKGTRFSIRFVSTTRGRLLN